MQGGLVDSVVLDKEMIRLSYVARAEDYTEL